MEISDFSLNKYKPYLFFFWFSRKQVHSLYFITVTANQFVFYNRDRKHTYFTWPYPANQAVLLHDKAKTKIEIPWERKELFWCKKKHISSFANGFSVAKNYLRPEGATLLFQNNQNWHIDRPEMSGHHLYFLNNHQPSKFLACQQHEFLVL